MRAYDPQKDSIGLGQLNTPLAQELQEVINHMSDVSQHITSSDRQKWDNKLDIETGAIVTTTTNGLMSFADKQKLNSIAYNANMYIHPKSGVVAGTYNSVVVDEYGHVIEAGTVTSIGDAESLGGVAANQYARLLSPVFRGTPTMSNTPNEEDYDALANVKFVRQYVDNAAFSNYGFTEADVARWNNKWDDTNAPAASEINSGIMTANDKKALNRLSSLFTNITADIVESWSNKMEYNTAPLATQTSKGLMSASDKQILDNISNTGGITAEERERWNAKLDIATGAVATETSNGLMSSEDKINLSNLLSRNVITNDMISRWNNKVDLETGATATESANGLMSYEDKRTLNALKDKPSVTTDDIARWNAKQEAVGLASSTTNGLMSSVDYQKLESLSFAADLNDTKMEQIKELVDTLSPATESSDGLMSKSDKANLNQIMNDRNRYVQVTQDQVTVWDNIVTLYNQDIKVTPEQVARWNNVATNTITADQLASAMATKVDLATLFTDEKLLYQSTNNNSTNGISETTNRLSLFNTKGSVKSDIAVASSGTPIQISVADNNRGVTTGIYVANGGAYYFENATATVLNDGLKLATQNDLLSLSTQMTAIENSVTNLVSNQKTGVERDLEAKLDKEDIIKDGVFSYTTGNLQLFSNPVTNGFYNHNDNSTSFIGTTTKTDTNHSNVQLYSVDNMSKIGPRLILSADHGMFYTFSDTGTIEEDREVAVVANLNDLSGTIGTIDRKLVSKLTDVYATLGNIISANDTKYENQIDSVYTEIYDLYTATSTLSQSLGSLLRGKLIHNNALLSSMDTKHTDSENQIISSISQLKTIASYLASIVKASLEEVPADYDANTDTSSINTTSMSYMEESSINNIEDSDEYDIGISRSGEDFTPVTMETIPTLAISAEPQDEPEEITSYPITDVDNSYTAPTTEEQTPTTPEDTTNGGE